MHNILLKYQEYQFNIINTYTSYIKIDNKETHHIFDNILMCRTLDNDSYLYFKDIDKLYKIITQSWLTSLIIQDTDNLKYNLFNKLSGQLRFNINAQADNYIKNNKMHDFIINDIKYTGLYLYNFKAPLK